jgi:hypothetical protein
LNESDRVREADQIPDQTLPATLTLLSNTSAPAPSLTPILYGNPEISKHPKQNWNSRYPTDLISKPKKQAKQKLGKKQRKQGSKEKEIQFIGLLQGLGGQRSRIQVEVGF